MTSASLALPGAISPFASLPAFPATAAAAARDRRRAAPGGRSPLTPRGGRPGQGSSPGQARARGRPGQDSCAEMRRAVSVSGPATWLAMETGIRLSGAATLSAATGRPLELSTATPIELTPSSLSPALLA